MSVLITGATGFIGSNLANMMNEGGYDVYVTGTSGEQKPKYITKVDLGSTNDWKQLKKNNLSVVIHLAANNDTLDTDRDGMFDANVRDSMALFRRAIDIGVQKFVYASSTAVYGDSPAPYIEGKTPIKPLNVYAESKATLEEYASYLAKSAKVNMVGLRFCNVYGPGEDHKGTRASMIYQLYDLMNNGKNPRIFLDGNQKRDWVYVVDACRCLLAATHYWGVDVFNCGSGAATTFNKLVEILNDKLATKFGIHYFDNPNAAAYQAYTECDMGKARDKLGFVPNFDIYLGIEKLVKHYADKKAGTK